MEQDGSQGPRAPGSGGRSQVPEPTQHPTSGTFQIKKECLACRGAAAVFDMSYFGKFYLVGLDARKAADWLFSADVSRPPGTEPRWATLSHFGAAPGTETRQGADPVLSGLIWLMAPPRGLALGPRVQTPLPSWLSPGPRPPPPSSLPLPSVSSSILPPAPTPTFTLFQTGFQAASPQNSLLGLGNLSTSPPRNALPK